MTDLRALILSIDKNIGEEVKWNAPTFFYAGPMKASDPKKYDCLRLVFPSGAKIEDASDLPEGD